MCRSSLPPCPTGSAFSKCFRQPCVFQSRKRRIPTSEFNDYILPIIEETPPPSIKGKYIRIKYAAQLPNPTPVFAFFVNLPQYIKDAYRRFLENKIREHWDFSGVPIQIYFRQK